MFAARASPARSQSVVLSVQTDPKKADAKDKSKSKADPSAPETMATGSDGASATVNAEQPAEVANETIEPGKVDSSN